MQEEERRMGKLPDCFGQKYTVTSFEHTVPQLATQSLTDDEDLFEFVKQNVSSEIDRFTVTALIRTVDRFNTYSNNADARLQHALVTRLKSN